MPETEKFGFDLLIFSDGFSGGSELSRLVERLKAQVVFAALTAEAEERAKKLGYSVHEIDFWLIYKRDALFYISAQAIFFATLLKSF